MSKSKSVYDYIIEKKWDAAIDLAYQNYENSQNWVELMNIYPPLLIQGKYQKVLDVVNEVWKKKGKESEVEYQWAAIAHVGLNDINSAIKLLEEARNCKYSDPTGGVEIELLILSLSLIISDEVIKERVLENIYDIIFNINDSTVWPAPLGVFMLNGISFNNVLSVRSDMNSIRDRESCQAFFYKGIKELENGSKENCVTNFNECRQSIPQNYFMHEYHLSYILEKYLINL